MNLALGFLTDRGGRFVRAAVGVFMIVQGFKLVSGLWRDDHDEEQ